MSELGLKVLPPCCATLDGVSVVQGRSCAPSRRSATVPALMLYRIELLIWSNLGDEALHEIEISANTYAIVEAVEATRDTDSENCRFTARINAPSPEAALGTVLTVIAQSSGYVGLAEEGSMRRVTIEREDPPSGESSG